MSDGASVIGNIGDWFDQAGGHFQQGPTDAASMKNVYDRLKMDWAMMPEKLKSGRLQNLLMQQELVKQKREEQWKRDFAIALARGGK